MKVEKTGRRFRKPLTGPLAAPNEGPDQRHWLSLTSKVLLASGFMVLAAWFLHAFTYADQEQVDNACQAEQRASMFRFAYLFSIFSFALLVLPFTAMLRTNEPPDAGPIRLLRACVMPLAGSAPASGVKGPVDLCPQPGMEDDFTFPWLVSVGGVVAQRCGTGTFRCAGATGSGPTPPPLYSVSGGFVVPFYVLVFSFVGGVVNLTRRVPEYQKRSSCHFKGTASESCVTLLEAREFVVFQIMQMLSSPFVAMVAYYALEPKSVASAVGLAFIAGFATESVLLLIRGMVTGLRPETTKTVALSATTQSHLHVALARGASASVDRTRV